MTKKILSLAIVGLLVGAGLSEATQSASQRRELGKGVVTVILTMPSQAQNAIDTSFVDVSDGDWTSLPAAAPLAVLKATIGAVFGTSQDSVNTQIGHGVIGADWVDDYSLANTGTNLTTSVPNKAIAFTTPARFLRIIVKNVDATAGAAKVAICYPVKQAR